MNSYVLDTSVIAKWYRSDTSEPAAGIARALLRAHLMGIASVAVPELALFELGNVLAGAPELSDKVKAGALERFFRLGLNVVPFDRGLATGALNIALRDNLTYYDAAFVALAKSTDTEFITADKKLLGKISYPKSRLLDEVTLP